jgi:hypothetical protein
MKATNNIDAGWLLLFLDVVRLLTGSELQSPGCGLAITWTGLVII